MLTQAGQGRLLASQMTYLASLQWALFTNNVQVTAQTLWSDLTEAAWAGYSRVTAGPWTSPGVVGSRSTTSPVTVPTFTNTSGLGEIWYGWALVDPIGPTLVAGDNIGQQVLPDSAVYALGAAITDVDESLLPK